MSDYLLLATTNGLGVYARDGAGWRELRQGLTGHECCASSRAKG